MKRLLLAALIATACCGAIAQISIPLGQTGYYGRIDLGNLGAPPVIYQEPMLVERPRDYRPVAPIYLRVPRGHATQWSRHCSAYNACNRPVYFVQDRWYNNTYVRQHGGGDADRENKDYDKERAKDRRENLKEREKDRRESEKEREKDRREASKEYDKDRREAQKEYDKDRLEFDKERRKAEKEYSKNQDRK
ncbi:hypothetical protein [Massilia eurypsychrophila]|uniref:hypothetical protein n=1 Tax=Massilia eurypsychrophila TaxID=1485217 RepID=UPI00103509BF|nr:hypothetical protein [Massilia eurypsychrophila]